MKKCKNKSNIEIVKSYLNNERPFIQVGFVPESEVKHKDGDVWVDKDGREWIQKGASKISKKLFDTREKTRQTCSVCKKDIFWSNDSYDEKFFNKTGKCYGCVVEEETKLRLFGKYDIYEKIKVIKNQQSFLMELKEKIEESIKWLKNKSNKIEYFNEDGTVETWTDLSREDLLKTATADLAETVESLNRCESSIFELEEKINE